MIKQNKLWQIIWIVGIYLILILILYLVVTYKIKFEDRDYTKYLYFYNCSDELCTTNIKQEEYINKIECEKETCPYIKEIKGKIAIMVYPSSEKIYNYETGKIISENYQEYYFLDDENIAFKDKNNKYGIINTQNEIINNPEIDQIISYKESILVYKQNNKYSIKKIYNTEEINTDLKYDDIKFINNEIFAAKIDNKYKILNFKEEQKTDKEYTYIFSENGYIFAFSDNKLDILNSDLESKLLMKIKTYYNYQSQKEILSLNKRVEEGILTFIINTSDTKGIKYYFDLEKGIIINN